MFVIKIETLTLVINSFDTTEQAFVEKNAILEIGQDRSYFVRNSIHLFISVRLKNIVENTTNTIKYDATAIQCYNRILERGCIFVIDNSIYLLLIETDSLFESRKIMFELNLVKRRYAKWCLRLIE